MSYSNKFKLVSGSVGVAVALSAGAALASDRSAAEPEIELDDIVAITEVDPPALSSLESLDAVLVVDTFPDSEPGDSLASPFDVDESADEADSAASVDDSVASADDSVDESVASVDDSVESADDSPDKDGSV